MLKAGPQGAGVTLNWEDILEKSQSSSQAPVLFLPKLKLSDYWKNKEFPVKEVKTKKSNLLLKEKTTRPPSSYFAALIALSFLKSTAIGFYS